MSIVGDVNFPSRSCGLTAFYFFLWNYLKVKLFIDNTVAIIKQQQELKEEEIKQILPG